MLADCSIFVRHKYYPEDFVTPVEFSILLWESIFSIVLLRNHIEHHVNVRASLGGNESGSDWGDMR